ncbi:nadph-dependent fmn reductase [hydrocarbon metagenome]|uniref:Nadph-dependent fmn reductase n=1 Tax=hydrocarbon metagenome TaxID=938273 RepID=A0A0W8FQT9_9ZZZZ
MLAIGINGSPRKNGNTATLLTKALEGAASHGADTELIHLYDLSFKGCSSCFACKLIGRSQNGICVQNDDLNPILKKIVNKANGLILGTPIYFGSMTGEMRSLIERLLFAPLVYTMPTRSILPRKINTGIIYTMNITEEMCEEQGLRTMFQSTEKSFRMIFGGTVETFCCYDTCQFPVYAEVVMEYMDPVQKAQRREQVFPNDCRKAFEFGCRVANKSGH